MNLKLQKSQIFFSNNVNNKIIFLHRQNSNEIVPIVPYLLGQFWALLACFAIFGHKLVPLEGTGWIIDPELLTFII